MVSEQMKVLVAGGGIGGLTAALECARQGFSVEVFEQAAEFSDVGAGIQLSPNPSRVLLSLGLGDALRSVAFLPEGTEFRHWRTGKLLSHNPLGPVALEKYGAPYYHVHRADLTRMLAEAAAAEPNVTLHTNVRVTDFSQTASEISLETDSGSFSGSVLIGADGIHSVVRAGLFGPSTAHRSPLHAIYMSLKRSTSRKAPSTQPRCMLRMRRPSQLTFAQARSGKPGRQSVTSSNWSFEFFFEIS